MSSPSRLTSPPSRAVGPSCAAGREAAVTTRVGLVVQSRSAEVQASWADAVPNDLLDGLLPPDNPPPLPSGTLWVPDLGQRC